jgi:glycosyl transferase family 25
MKALVIHVAKMTERGEHIDHMLRTIGMDYEFVLDADADTLTPELIGHYLKDGPEHMTTRLRHASCTIKHLMACERIINQNLEGALVLEDDIVLHDDFMPRFQQSINEWRQQWIDQPVIISYEDSSLQFVPRSQRHEGQMLYPGRKDRMAGAYFVSRHAAEAVIADIVLHKTDIPIDCYHTRLLQHGTITYLWCQPALATQGSFTGAFKSSLTSKKDRLITIRWWFKKNYKRLLYWLR